MDYFTHCVALALGVTLGFMIAAMIKSAKQVDVREDADEARFIVEQEHRRWSDVLMVFDRFSAMIDVGLAPKPADARYVVALLGRALGKYKEDRVTTTEWIGHGHR